MKSNALISLITLPLITTTAIAGQHIKTPSTQDQTLYLYSKDNLNAKDKTPISHLNRWVQFYHKGHWIKVGNRETGKIGWINEPQLYKWHQHKYQPQEPHVQTVFITTQTESTNGKDKNHTPKTTIVAYKNGQKVSPKDAKKIYEAYLKDQQKNQEQWAKLNQDFQNIYQQQMNLMNWHPMITTHWPSMPIPVVVVHPTNHHPHHKTADDSAHTSKHAMDKSTDKKPASEK